MVSLPIVLDYEFMVSTTSDVGFVTFDTVIDAQYVSIDIQSTTLSQVHYVDITISTLTLL